MTNLGPNDPCHCGSGKKYKKCHMAADRRGGGSVSAAAAPITRRKPTVLAGKVSPRRSVPDHIPAPDYAKTGKPRTKEPRSPVKSAEEIERMREATRVARTVLSTLIDAAREGVTTDELDALGHATAIEMGAYPSPLNYRKFPKSICTSVNEVICHGIPDSRPLQDGDIVNIDVTTFFNGMHGDCSETIFIGQPSERARKLVETTYECMMLGIDAVRPGRPVSDIGRAIEAYARKHGYSVVRDFTGHGIGQVFHMTPHVMHYYSPTYMEKMRPGMTFTVEPMINEGVAACDVWRDDWTAVTKDLMLSAQFEHTILVTNEGYEMLTLPEG
ncbi:MAG: type I methionyl aminopeptidase, partial [Planctomycetes bacterium]|nr:type I methionyl aminopeptidase [Planctomycetota bacterium]